MFDHKTLAIIHLIALACIAGCTTNSGPPQVVDQAQFTPLFNGHDLIGFKGLVQSPAARAAMTAAQLEEAQIKANADMQEHWTVANGTLIFDGKGHSIATVNDYQDFELHLDWKIQPRGDSGIYLRGTPQVQIWDNADGSGGLYNNQKNPSKPSLKADNPPGSWNTFRITMIGQNVTVYLNDQLVVNNIPLENYWERDKPIYPSGQIELQSHGSVLQFRNIKIREISPAQ